MTDIIINFSLLFSGFGAATSAIVVIVMLIIAWFFSLSPKGLRLLFWSEVTFGACLCWIAAVLVSYVR